MCFQYLIVNIHDVFSYFDICNFGTQLQKFPRQNCLNIEPTTSLFPRTPVHTEQPTSPQVKIAKTESPPIPRETELLKKSPLSMRSISVIVHHTRILFDDELHNRRVRHRSRAHEPSRGTDRTFSPREVTYRGIAPETSSRPRDTCSRCCSGV